MLKELLVFFIIICIATIVVAVSFPPLVLEPISWMLNSDIEVHKYGHTRVANQSTSFFDFYLPYINETYTKLPTLALAILGGIIFTPIIMCLLTVFSLHLKAKNKMKDLRQSYLPSLFEAFSEGKVKPPFYLVFCPLVAVIYLTKTQYHQEVVNITNQISPVISSKKIYKPATLTNYNNQEILWEVMLEEKHPITFTKHGYSFSRVNNYNAVITAKENNDKTIFNIQTDAQISSTIEFIDPYILIINKETLSAINTKDLKVSGDNIAELAKDKNPRFNKIFNIRYNFNNRNLKLTDIYENQTTLSLNEILDIPAQGVPFVKNWPIEKMGKKDEKLKTSSLNSQFKSKQYIQSEKIIKNDGFTLLRYKSDLTQKNKNNLALLDSHFNEAWSYSLSSHSPYLKPFENQHCKQLHASHTERLIAISYQLAGITCATEFINKHSGILEARYVAGSLEYF